MKKIEIKGKDYVEVHERVKEFHNQYKKGSITTEIIEMTDRFITKTTVIPDIGVPERYFTGVAYEKEDEGFINKTSALENCETSAVGRALGILGIGIDGSIASAEEMQNAVHQQQAHNVTEQQKDKYQKLLKHKCFDGKKKKTNEWWVHIYDAQNPKDAADKALKTMEAAIKVFENPKTIKQEEK